MLLTEVRQFACELLARYDLPEWSFAFNRSKTNMGLCLFGPQQLQLSTYFVLLNEEPAIRDTLLHELAHALVGPGHGHDEVWKRQAMALGAIPERLSFDVHMPTGRWQATCGGCGMLHHRHRRPKHMVGWHCRHCGRERGRLIWNRAG